MDQAQILHELTPRDVKTKAGQAKSQVGPSFGNPLLSGLLRCWLPMRQPLCENMLSTFHKLINGDARDLSFLEDESVHLVVTSPPYWNLKRYNENPDQLGHIQDYEAFLGRNG